MARVTKKDIYASHNVEYIAKGGYIVTPWGQKIKPVLKDGNDKLGKRVKNFSTLPTDNKAIPVNMGTKENPDIRYYEGTCQCTCRDPETGEITCYACHGRCAMDCCRRCWATHTTLAREYMEWLENAISAQIEADKILIVRIHVSGDFFSPEYVAMWRRIAESHKNTIFWTYTKVSYAEHAFDDVENLNVVNSKVPGHGANYGHISHIISLYEYLKSQGEDVYICRCGIDKNQHCEKCNSCYTRKYVLFLEHSTSYVPEEDPLWDTFVALVESQAAPVPVI